MQDNWVDFKAVKAVVSMQMLLDRYQVNWLRKSGKELRGRCPIHKGDGQDAFHVNLAKNAFNCFSCQARGNVLDFVAAMEQCSVRDAGLKLKEWFSISSEPAAAPTKAKPAAGSGGVGEQATAGNKPLAFQLKGVDPNHPYLAERGISRETAETFGIGFFAGKGSMSGRVVIPIHNQRGELVAYAGRSIDGSEPRYKLPAGFHKSLELFNLHRVLEATAEMFEPRRKQPIVVVEGFFDCLQVTQAGFPCVALMGCSMSEAQEKLLVKYFESAWLMLDGDEAGRAATLEISGRLLYSHWIRAVSLVQGIQPDQLSIEELRLAIGSM
jgi:DNA primase